MFGSVAQMKTANAARTPNTIADCAAATTFVPIRLSTSMHDQESVMKTLSQPRPAFSPTNSAVA